MNARFNLAKNLCYAVKNMIMRDKELIVEEKNDQTDLVTNMDKKIEAYITAAINRYFPDDTIVGEEKSKEFSSKMWIIDPIDGTCNYITKKCDYTISLAYYENYDPVFGIVYDVRNDLLYHGIANDKAYLNGEELEIVKHRIDQSILDVSMHSQYLLKRRYDIDLLDMIEDIRGQRSINCASLAICHIALGIADMYISANLKCWDYAAADIILKCVGGKNFITDFFSVKPQLAVFAASNEQLDYVLNKVKKALI